jgi:hypothetical protein
MFSFRRFPLLAAVVIVLGATGAVTSLHHAENPSVLPSGFQISLDAESTALYCTGLSNASGTPGRVTFYNTAAASRNLSVSVVSNKGNTWHGSLELGAHATQSIEPSVLDKSAVGDDYGVAVQISGGGVVGEEIAGTQKTSVPCDAGGIRHWYATGFNTVTGSSAYLSVYNPTATSAVFDASIFTAAGFSAPEAFQGVSVPAHTQMEIDLGTEVVNTTNVGVGVTVLRGSLEIVGVEDSAGTVSFDQGATSTSQTSWFPNVTTVQAATSQIRVANPNSTPVTVTLDVALSSFKIAPQTLTIEPFTTSLININPNPAIPAAGYANLTLHSSEPVFSSLATGNGTWTALSAPEPEGNAFLVRDFTGQHFDAATVTNTSSRTVSLKIVTYSSTTPSASAKPFSVKLAANATENLSTLIPSFATSSDAFLISGSSPSLVVSMTLPSQPKGVNVVPPLNGK